MSRSAILYISPKQTQLFLEGKATRLFPLHLSNMEISQEGQIVTIFDYLVKSENIHHLYIVLGTTLNYITADTDLDSFTATLPLAEISLAVHKQSKITAAVSETLITTITSAAKKAGLHIESIIPEQWIPSKNINDGISSLQYVQKLPRDYSYKFFSIESVPKTPIQPAPKIPTEIPIFSAPPKEVSVEKQKDQKQLSFGNLLLLILIISIFIGAGIYFMAGLANRSTSANESRLVQPISTTQPRLKPSVRLLNPQGDLQRSLILRKLLENADFVVAQTEYTQDLNENETTISFPASTSANEKAEVLSAMESMELNNKEVPPLEGQAHIIITLERTTSE